MLLGLLCALSAAVAFGSAAVLQSVGVRRADPVHSGALDLKALSRQPLYLLGLVVDGAGFVLMLVALQTLPLFLVQAVVATSVAVTTLLAVLTGSRLRRSGWWALGAAALGVVLLSVAAESGAGRQLPVVWQWLMLAAVPVFALVGVLAPRWSPRVATAALAVAAGGCFSIVAIASRTLDWPTPVWRILLTPALWAVAAAGVVGTVLFAAALRAGSVTTVAAITVSAQTVVPAAVGLAFLGDAVRHGYWPVAAAGFVLAVAGAIALAGVAESPAAAVLPIP